jgi:uncharacterized protein (DUF433 family)
MQMYESEAVIQSINMIAIHPKVRSGRPYIVGTTSTVADIAVVHVYHRQDADGIAQWYGLSLPQVHAALSYYFDHKVEIDAQIQAQMRRFDELKEQRVGSENSLLPR